MRRAIKHKRNCTKGQFWFGMGDLFAFFILALMFIFFFFYSKFVFGEHEIIDDYRLQFTCDELAMDFLQTSVNGTKVFAHMINDTDGINGTVADARFCIGLVRSDGSFSQYGSDCNPNNVDLDGFLNVHTYIAGAEFAFDYSEVKRC